MTVALISKEGTPAGPVFDYFPYGKQKEEVVTPEKITQTFTGKEFDLFEQDTTSGDDGEGWYYFGARYYDPEVGIWTATDPAGQFWNSYSYTGGNPINGIDPNGLETYYNSDGSFNGVMAIQDYDDPSMFMVGDGGGLSFLGEMGGNVNVTAMYDQMLLSNGALAEGMHPIDVYNAVKTGGMWDFKNISGHLFSSDNAGNYQLQYRFENWDFDDFGNHHFGYVTQKNGWNLVISQMGAGAVQFKRGLINGDYPVPWGFWKTYFDDPRDSKMIGRGHVDAMHN